MNRPFMCMDDLRQNPVFEDLSDQQLTWLVDHAQCLELAPGDALWTAGQPADAMFVVLSGEMQLFFDIAGQNLRIDASSRNGVIGMLPYSRMTEFMGKTRAAESTRVLRIGKDQFPAMLSEIPELGYRLVALLSDRVRSGTRVADQRDKMMALGKLAAGLAHELNNPAAALQRTADELSQRLQHSNALVSKIAEHRLEPEQMHRAVQLREVGSPGQGAKLSVMDRGDREEELGDWLEDQGIEDAWVLAEAFVDAGLEVDGIREMCQELPDSAAPDILAWIGSGLAARQLLAQVTDASARISNLVSSVKSYSHMDQTPDKTPTDIHQGLESTLAMMKHKMEQKNVRLERHYDSGMPKIPAQVSDLNQVWTNLIDNAVDAMEDGGKLEVRTEQDGYSALIQIIDDGAGIEAEHQEKIFDPFFTTKAVGQGTGLGLDIVHHIVQQHEGEITLESEPGRTAFTVRLSMENQHE